MSKDRMDIATRMKRYENVSAWELPRRIPAILRIDGKAFHSLTKRFFDKGWSEKFVDFMKVVAVTLQKEMQGCKICYCQSDEISFLITDYDRISTEPWLGYDARKMISISAAIASATFTQNLMVGGSSGLFDPRMNAYFDSRVFSIPADEVVNYYYWRQLDATRNAIQMAGREHFSQKQMLGKSCNQVQEMLFQEKGINFDKYPIIRKRGFCIVEGRCDESIPIFSKDRNYIEQWVNIRKD